MKDAASTQVTDGSRAPDAETGDSALDDSGALDSGSPDAETGDSALDDSGALDSGSPDAETGDSALDDSGALDSGLDASDDASPDDASPDDAFPDDAFPDDAFPDDAFPDDSATVTTVTFGYTGAAQSFVVPADVSFVTIVASGAAGGAGRCGGAARLRRNDDGHDSGHARRDIGSLCGGQGGESACGCGCTIAGLGGFSGGAAAGGRASGGGGVRRPPGRKRAHRPCRRRGWRWRGR